VVNYSFLSASRPWLRFTVRRLAFVIALLGINLAIAHSVSTFSSRFSRPNLYPYVITGSGHGMKFPEVDGSLTNYRGDDPYISHPHVTRPPQPSLLRIWCPLIASAASSVLVVVLGLLGVGRGLSTMRNRRWVWLAAAMLIWLIVPLIRIILDPEKDYHIHDCKDIYFLKSVHETPFWARYWRHLLFRPSPGDYVCPLDPEWSIPPPNRTKEWLIF